MFSSQMWNLSPLIEAGDNNLGSYVRFHQYEVGSNKTSEYVPYYSLFNRAYVRGTVDTYIYRKLKMGSERGTMVHTTGTQYENLFNTLNFTRPEVIRFLFNVKKEAHELFISNGIIMDGNEDILMVLTTNSYYLQKNRKSMANYRLYVSSEFMTNPTYKNIWKKINDEYVTEMYQNEIDVVTTTSAKIDKLLFNAKPKIEYGSIEQLSQNLRNVNNSINLDLFRRMKRVRGLNSIPKEFNLPITQYIGLYKVNLDGTKEFDYKQTNILTAKAEKNVFDHGTDDLTMMSFKEFLVKATTENLGIPRKVSYSNRNEFLLATFNPNTWELSTTGTNDIRAFTLVLEILDHDPVAEYEAELATQAEETERELEETRRELEELALEAEEFQENVNFDAVEENESVEEDDSLSF